MAPVLAISILFRRDREKCWGKLGKESTEFQGKLARAKETLSHFWGKLEAGPRHWRHFFCKLRTEKNKVLVVEVSQGL